MKKIIAILITMTMLFSLLSIPSAFAYSGEFTPVWTQDFERNHATDSDAQWSQVSKSYASGGRIASASSGTAEMSNFGKDSSNAMKFYGNTDNKSNNGAAAKIMIDNTVLELGKKYVLKADVYVAKCSTTTKTTQKITLSVLRGVGSNKAYGQDTVVPVGEWATVTSAVFLYDNSLKNFTGTTSNDVIATHGLNARLDASLARVSASDLEIIYVDNFRVEDATSVTTYFDDSISSDDGGVANFDDIDEDYKFVDNVDFETNGTSGTITNAKDANNDGNSFYFVPTNLTASRLVLTDLFKREDLGKSYKVSFKIYMTDTTAEYINVGTKATLVDNNNIWGTDLRPVAIGEGKDIVPGKWSTIELVSTVTEYNGTLIDGIGLTFNEATNTISKKFAASNSFAPYYIDDVVVTPINYFENIEGEKINTEAEAGYYTDTADANKKEGAILINSYISNEGSVIQRYTNFGLWIYRQDDPTKEATISLTCTDASEADADKTNRQQLIASKGYISALVEGISEEFFGTKIVAVPFVVMRGETFWGDEFTFCVNDAAELKYLGTKDIAE